jgi:hypothetical protein
VEKLVSGLKANTAKRDWVNRNTGDESTFAGTKKGSARAALS